MQIMMIDRWSMIVDDDDDDDDDGAYKLKRFNG